MHQSCHGKRHPSLSWLIGSAYLFLRIIYDLWYLRKIHRQVNLQIWRRICLPLSPELSRDWINSIPSIMNKQQSTSGGRRWVVFNLSFHFCLKPSCLFHLPRTATTVVAVAWRMGSVQDEKRRRPRWVFCFLFLFLIFTYAILLFSPSSFFMLSFKSHSGLQIIHNT